MACVDGVCLIYPALIRSTLPSPLLQVGLVASILSHVLVGQKTHMTKAVQMLEIAFAKRRTKNSASFWICFVKCVSSKAYKNVWGQRPSEVAGDTNWFCRSCLRRTSVSIPSILFCTGCHAGPRQVLALQILKCLRLQIMSGCWRKWNCGCPCGMWGKKT